MANLGFGTNGSSYYDYARQGKVFMAQAVITAPVGYGTAAGTGGPLLWNGTGGTTSGVNNSRVNAIILGMSYAITTAETTTNIALGLTGGPSQAAAPTATTAIDGLTSTLIGQGNATTATGMGNACSVYRVGTVSAAGKWFFPLTTLSTVTIAGILPSENYVDLAGMFVVPPGSWISVSASVTGTAAVLQVGLVWAEVSY
jgi:hypothetical protein